MGCLVLMCDVFDSNSSHDDSLYNLGWEEKEKKKKTRLPILTHYLNNYTRGNRIIPSQEEPIPNLENIVSSWPQR